MIYWNVDTRQTMSGRNNGFSIVSEIVAYEKFITMTTQNFANDILNRTLLNILSVTSYSEGKFHNQCNLTLGFERYFGC